MRSHPPHSCLAKKKIHVKSKVFQQFVRSTTTKSISKLLITGPFGRGIHQLCFPHSGPVISKFCTSRCHHEIPISHDFVHFRDARRTIKVQCFPLYSILLAVGVTKIDFFSLDVEGAEQTVLESIPLDKVDVGLFVIEYLDVSPEKKAKRLEGFRKHFEKVGGYKYLGEHHGVDALFQTKVIRG